MPGVPSREEAPAAPGDPVLGACGRMGPVPEGAIRFCLLFLTLYLIQSWGALGRRGNRRSAVGRDLAQSRGRGLGSPWNPGSSPGASTALRAQVSTGLMGGGRRTGIWLLPSALWQS